MNIIASLRQRADRLARGGALDVEVDALPTRAAALPDTSLLQLRAEVAAIANDAGRLQTVLAGVAAHRSRREHGHTGLAATQGHATPQPLIQAITGTTRVDATRHVRVGMSLMECPPDPDDAPEQGQTAGSSRAPWHAPLQRALLDDTLTTAQHDAIRTGVGEPDLADPALGDPGLSDRGPEVPGPNGLEHPASADAVVEAWSLATESLIVHAQTMPTEELAKKTRTLRDLLDPVGTEARFARRYENRSWRMWVCGDGQHRARIAFDDEMALWARTLLNSALRPRRGGSRFVADDERTAAAELARRSTHERTTRARPHGGHAPRRVPRIRLRRVRLPPTRRVDGPHQERHRSPRRVRPAHRHRTRRRRRRRTPWHRDRSEPVHERVPPGHRRLVRQPPRPRTRTTPLHREATPDARRPRRRMPLARLSTTRLVLRSPPLRPRRRRPRTHPHRPRCACIPQPGHGRPIALHSKAARKWAWDPSPPPRHARWRTG